MRWRPARVMVVAAVAGAYAALAYACAPEASDPAEALHSPIVDSGIDAPPLGDGPIFDTDGGSGGPTVDARTDGGMDASDGGFDGPPADAGVPDAGLDGGGDVADAAPDSEDGDDESSDSTIHGSERDSTSFYACSATPGSSTGAWPLGAAAVLLAARRRRRRP